MTSVETGTKTHRALCSRCGTERTVRMGGPRNYFPRGWNYETCSAELKCDSCGGLRAHAVLVERTGIYYQRRYAAIKAMADAERAGITVVRKRLKSADCQVSQRLDTFRWKIYIDSRLAPDEITKAIGFARDYITGARELRWWVDMEDTRRFPYRRYAFCLNSHGLPAWRESDREVEL